MSEWFPQLLLTKECEMSADSAIVPNYVDEVVMPWVQGVVEHSPYYFASYTYMDCERYRQLPAEYKIRVDEFAQAVMQIPRIDELLVEIRGLFGSRSEHFDVDKVPTVPDDALIEMLYAGFNRLPNCSRDIGLLTDVLASLVQNELSSARSEEVYLVCNSILNLYVCFAESTGQMAREGALGRGYMSHEKGSLVLYYIARYVDLSGVVYSSSMHPSSLN